MSIGYCELMERAIFIVDALTVYLQYIYSVFIVYLQWYMHHIYSEVCPVSPIPSEISKYFTFSQSQTQILLKLS